MPKEPAEPEEPELPAEPEEPELPDEPDVPEEINNSSKKTFAPEFLNRVDDIVIFNTLEKKDIEKIVLPFLYNLSKSDEPYIHWPNRGPIIKAQIEKILKLTRG